MRRVAWISLVATVACVATAEAQTSLYKWIDNEGKTHYTDTPPPPDIKNVQQKRLGDTVPTDDQLPYATREAAKRNPVVLYTANDCASICTDARNLLVARGVPYAEKNVSGSPQLTEELTKLVGSAQVPLLLIGNKQLAGFEAGGWNSGLDAGGYPRTNALPPAQKAALKADADKADAAAAKADPAAAKAPPAQAPVLQQGAPATAAPTPTAPAPATK